MIVCLLLFLAVQLPVQVAAEETGEVQTSQESAPAAQPEGAGSASQSAPSAPEQGSTGESGTSDEGGTSAPEQGSAGESVTPAEGGTTAPEQGSTSESGGTTAGGTTAVEQGSTGESGGTTESGTADPEQGSTDESGTTADPKQGSTDESGTTAEDGTTTPEQSTSVDGQENAGTVGESGEEKGRATSTESSTVTGAGDTEDESYSVPSGSAYIFEIGKTSTYYNDANKGSAIQQGLEGALTYIGGLYESEESTADRTATLVVSKGTYENGITLDSMESESTLGQLILDILGLREEKGATGDKLTIRIVAEDAIEQDADGNITGVTSDASGEVQLEGDVNILAGNLNLNLILAGLYYSTRGLINTEDVDSLTVMGTRKDDYITISAKNVGSSVQVDTGTGDDVVKVEVSGRAGVAVDTVTYIQLDILLRAVNDLEEGSLADTISKTVFPTDIFGDNFVADTVLGNLSKFKELQTKLSAAAKNASTTPINVNINTGDGNDKLNLNLLDSTRLESSKILESDVTVDISQVKEDMKAFPVSWLTQMGLYVDVSAFNVNVDGGNGADQLTITGERDSSNAYPLVKAASDYVFKEMGKEPTASITVNGGAGDDVITVDNSVLFATRGTTKVITNGGTGFDRLHLTGVLNSDISEDQRIQETVNADGVEFNIQAMASLTINDGYTTVDYKLSYPGAYQIISSNMDAYTDTLENKRTVELTEENKGSKINAQKFTNYVVAVGSDGSVSFDAADYLNVPENGNLLLASILVVGGEDQQITIEKLLAKELNVTIDADKIEVIGTILGRNILLNAYAEDKALVEISADVTVNTGADADTGLPGEVGIDGATLGVYEAKRVVFIKIGENARLTAKEAVDLTAALYLYHDFIPGLELLDESHNIKFNPVTVKAGNATIAIQGVIHAGGSIRMAADVDIDVDVTNGELKAIIPVSIGIIGGEAKVTVDGKADIRSGLNADTLYHVEQGNKGKLPATAAGTSLRADSTLRIQAHGGSGALPLSVALALVEFQTMVIVGGDAIIVAGGDVDVLARNHTVTGVSVCGYQTNKYSVKIKSGVFIAGTYAELNTGAMVRDNASLRSVKGSVNISGISRLHNTTVSVAIPAADAGGELTLLGAVKILNNLVDLGGMAKSVIPTLLEKAGLDQLKELFAKATESSGEDGDKTTQCLGAFAWAYLESQADATINTTGTIQAAGKLNLNALDEIRSEVRADGSLYKTSSYAKVSDNAIGAGLALVILKDEDNASIEKGTITAGGLDIQALLGDCVSNVVAKSGHVPEDAKLGLAGAVAVQLASFENTAAVNSGVTISLSDGSSVSIIADGSGWFVTVGDASGKRQRLSLDLAVVDIPLKPSYEGTASSTAIGAGIAVDTIGVTTWAGIEDNVTILVDGELEQLLVSANFAGDHYVEAAAGAKGGTSVVPVVALSLSGMDINAYIGKGAVLALTEDVTVTATGSWERTLISDAETGGAKAGMGAAVGVAIASDNVCAELNRSVSAKNVTVEAESISRVTETVKASAKGVNANSGSGTYGQGDNKTNATQEDVEKELSSNTTSKENPTVGGTDSTINKLISTLSGLASKLGKSQSKTNQSKNLDPGTVDTLGKSRPAAGTSEGNVEVAAAIAVNVQSNTVSARIGDGLTITTTGNVAVNSRQDTDATLTANGSAVKSTTGVGVAVAVNYVHYDNRAIIGTGKLTAGGDVTVCATIVEDAQKRTVEEILAELVKYFADEDGIDFLLNAVAEKQDKTAEELKEEILGKYCTDYEKLTDAQKKEVAAEVTKMLQASLSGDPVDTSVTLVGDVLDDILAEFRELFSDPQFFLSILSGDGEASERLEEIFNGMKLDGKITLSTIRELLSVALTEKFGNPSELDGMGNRITTVSISGEGASNVGVAGSVAVAYVDGTTQAAIEARDNAADQDIQVNGVVTIQSNAAQKVYTTATASAVANGAPDKNINKSSGSSVGVGASFAMSLADISAKAILGDNRTLTAAALGIQATAQNDVDTIAVAGQDPIGVQQEMATTTPKAGESQQQADNSTADDIGADAAVALTILSNTVYAQVCPGCKLTLTGGNILNTDLEKGNTGKERYNLIVDAYQRGQTLTSSSGFASAKKGAVGASVALNIASPDVLASLKGAGIITGKTLVQAQTFNEDEVKALAVVTGVNLDRYLAKIRSAMNVLNTTDRPSTGSINAKVVNALNGKAGDTFSNSANDKLPLSGMLAQKLNITLPDTKTDDKANNALKDHGKDSDGNNLSGQQYDNPNKGQSINIAAAIGINVTNHQSVAELNGSFTTENAKVVAENRGNFLTTGSGATVTIGDQQANNISAGIAVSVNNNKTDSSIAGTLRSPGGVSVEANSTQNMDGKYPGLLAAQAIAGSVGGTNAKVGLAGAIAVVVAQAQTRAGIAPGTVINPEDVENIIGNVRVESTDKSKLAIRAGSVMLGSAKVGMGASVGVLYAENGVYAEVGEGSAIRAKDMYVSATREKITTEDYKFPFDLSTLFTVNVPDDDTENKGFININISDGQGESKLGDNSLEVNLSAEDLLKVMDLLNYGTMANYYVETIAGSIPGNLSQLGLAGAISMIYATAETKARIGDDCQIDLTGKLDVEAKNETQVRQISGSLNASGGVGVGVNMTGYVNERKHTTLDENGNEVTKTLTDQTLAAIGKNAVVTAPNGIHVSALADTNVMAATIAAALATGTGNATIGGSLSTIAAGNVVKAIVGENTSLTAENGDIAVKAENKVFLLPISASVAGGVSKVAPGGTFSAIVVENQTEAAMGNSVKATAGTGITLSAVSEEKLVNWLNATSVSNGGSVAATIGVLVTNSRTMASVGEKAELTAKSGTIEIHAKGDVFQVVVLTGAAGSISGQVSAGAIVNVSVFNRKVLALVGSGAKLLASELVAGNNVLVLAEGKDRAYLISTSGSISTGSAAVDGNITVVVSTSTIQAEVGSDARIKAGDTVVVSADLDSDVIHGAVNVAASGGQVAVGATTFTLVVKNEIQSLIGDGAKIIACAAGETNKGGYTFTRGSNRDTRRKGIFLKANGSTRLVQATASAGGSGSVGVCGVVNTLVIQNHVLAQAGKKVVMSAGYDCNFADFLEATPETEEDGSDEDADPEPPYGKVVNNNAEVAVEADGDSEIYGVSGAVSGAGEVGVGASVVTLVVGKKVEALVGEDSFLQTTGDVTVTANSEDKNVIVTVSVAAAGNVSVGAGVSTLVYDNSVTASLQGTVYSDANVTVDADSKTDLALAACDVAAAGKAAVAGGSNALVFRSKVLAQLGGTVTAKGNVSVTSDNQALLVNVAGAAGGAGSVAVMPVAVVTTHSGSSESFLLEGSTIHAGGSFTLNANSQETITADAIGAAGSGTVAVSGAVVVSVSTQTTRAMAQADVSVTAATVQVAALDTTKFITAVGVVAGSGTTSVGVIASVTVLHNTVEAGFTGGTDREKNSIQSTSGDVTVTADAKRDIRAYALDVSGSGTVAVAPSVMVLVVGDKLDQDSADILSKGFDAKAFAADHFGDKNEYLAGYEMDNLAEKLEGDGQKNSDIQIGDDTGKADFGSGYTSEDFTNKDYQDTDDDTTGEEQNTGRGEDMKIDAEGNETISGTGSMLSNRPDYASKDAVKAIIGSGVSVTSAKDILVSAEDLLQAELFNTAISGSAVAAVGTGMSVAVLYSNVVAGVDAGAELNAKGDISVTAKSHSVPYTDNTSADTTRNDYLSKQTGNTLNVTNRTIRVVSITASGATAGVSVVGSVISLSNTTIAYMDGTVTGAKALTVQATTEYPNTLAVTGSGATGVAGVTASFAIVLTQATVEASIDGSVDRNTNGTTVSEGASVSGVNKITVQTDATFDATAISAALAAGGVGVNGGMALSVNRLKSNTFVGRNVTITGATTLDVTANHTTTANVYLLNVAGGGTASGVSAVVAIVAPEIYTYIGATPDSEETTSGTIQANTVNVKNTVTSMAKPGLAVATGGSVAITGAVVVVINDTDALTGILRKNLTAGTVNVSGNMDATAESEFASASVGSIAIGASIAYVQLRADNEARLDLTGAVVTADSVKVEAISDTKAVARALIVNAGGIVVNVNTAIADNRSANIARILGSEKDELTATGNVEILVSGTATAEASITGLNLAATLNVNGSIAVAVLRNQQKALVEGGSISAKAITVTSKLNESQKAKPTEADRVTAKATISVGSGGMTTLAADIAVAYGRSESIASIRAESLTVAENLSVATSGNAGTQAKISNLSGVSSLTGTVMAAFAYVQGKFEASILDLSDTEDSGEIKAGDISAKAENIQTFAVADVTPSVLGGDVSKLSIRANLAVASAKADILAKISRTGKVSGGTVTVLADTVSYAKSAIHTPTINLNKGTVAANVSVALLKTTQSAIAGGKCIHTTGTGMLKVISNLNKGYTGNTAEATAAGNKFGTSVLDAKVNVILARSRASSKASVEGGTDVYGIQAQAQGNSKAYAAPYEGTNVSFLGIGINAVLAEAAGTFQVILNPNAGTIQVGAGGINMENRYTADAKAISGQPEDGVKVDISYATVETNVAKAKTNVTASVKLTGEGTISTDGDLIMTAIGNATANATINKADFQASGISVAANVVEAIVDGTQNVEIQGEADATGALLTVDAKKRIKLDSQFNHKNSYTGKDYDAFATVGSNSGKSINMTFAGLAANTATAKMTAMATAAISSANVIAGYSLLVQTLGSSRAKANVDVGPEVGFKNVSVLVTDAQALGIFKASVDLATGNLNVGFADNQQIDGETLKQGNVKINVETETDAQATTANAGGAINIKWEGLKTNVATAKTGSNTTAAFGGNGQVKGDVTVQALGDVIANAVTAHPKITISGVDLTVNKTTATSAAEQTAKVTANGSMKINGSIDVTSALTSTVTSDVGGASADKGLKFSGISADINESSASGSTTNNASIVSGANGSSITANAITVNATTTSTVTATTKQGISTSLASFGGLRVSAYTQDQVSAFVGETADKDTTVKDLTVKANSLKVTANNNAEASAESNAMGSASLVSAKTSKSQAGVGTKDNKQTAQAGIGDKVAITLDGNLKIYAGNFGSATAALKKGKGVAIASFTDSKLPTISYYSTHAYVGDGASITAGGDVDIQSEDSETARSEAVSSTISFAVSTATVYGNNTITTDNLVDIGASGIFATGKITIKALSNVTMYARTVADTKGGFTSKSDLTARNILNRAVTANIGNGAQIESDFGDVEILAQAGTEDDIETQTRLEGLAFTDFKKTSAKSIITSTSKVLVGSAKITDTFGTVHIWADAAMNRFYSKAYAYASGLGAEPSATVIDVLSLVGLVKVTGTSDTPAELTARNLEIHTRNTKLNIESFAEASGKAFGANVDAKSELTVLLNATAVFGTNGEPEKDSDNVNKWNKVTDSGVIISNALLRGYDYVNITASSAPEYRARNIYGHSKIFLGAIGEGTARTDQLIVSNNSVALGSGVTVYSANATIRAIQFSGTTDYKKETSGFVKQTKAGKETKQFLTSTTVNSGTKFYIGDAAAGIVIDIYQKDGKTQVRQVGIKDERSIWTINANDRKVSFQRIANNKAGYLVMDVTTGEFEVYDQHFIPYVRITNHTNYAVELAGLTVENDNYISPRVTLGTGASYTVQNTDITCPEFTVTSYGTGNVHISGFVANPRGDVTFRWLGKDDKGKAVGGDLTSTTSVTSVAGGGETAPIWAHSLTVEGAKNVGTSEKVRFCVWLITHDGDAVTELNQASAVKIDASGNVYLELTPALLKIVASKDWTSLKTSAAAFEPNMDISHIATGGVADVLLEKGRRVYQKEGTSTVTMPIPGTLEYITDALVGLESSVTLTDRTKLEYYLESTDLATGVSVYYLPNGTRIYTNTDGEIVRIQEGGIDFGLADYSYDPNTNTVTLAEGVSFNLNNGTLSVLEGYSYEALLSAIDGEWLKSHIDNKTFQFLYRDPNEKESDALKLKKDDNGDYVTQIDDEGKKWYVAENGSFISEETFEATSAKVTTITPWYTSGNVTYYYLVAGTAPGTLISAAEGNQKTYILAYDSVAKTVSAYLMTAQGSGGNSETNRQEFVFYDPNDNYYQNKDDQETIEYWGEQKTVITRKRTEKDSAGNEITISYLLIVKNDNGGYTVNAADSTYTFTNFLSLPNGIGICYDEKSKKWTAVQGETEVELDQVRSFDGLNLAFGVSPDATSDNALAKQVYAVLSGKYWQLTRANGGTYSNYVCVYKGTQTGSQRNYTYWLNPQELKSYYYTYTYASLEEIGLILSPVGETTSSGTTSTSKPTHNLTFDTAAPSKFLIQDKAENVPVKAVAIGATTLTSATTGYRVTDTLYIQSVDVEGGTSKGTAILKKGGFTAIYNSGSGIYESDRIKATDLVRAENTLVYMPTITLRQTDSSTGKTQSIMLESITGTDEGSIARDMLGNYYYRTSTAWVKMSKTVATKDKQNGVPVDKTLNQTVDNATVKTTTLTYGGETKLIIEENQITLNLVGETKDHGILAVRTVKGQKEYYLLRNGVWASIQDYQAAEMVKNSTASETTLTMAVSTYITLKPSGTVVGSDGTVKTTETGTTQSFTEVTGTQYHLGEITGSSVIIRMPDTSGSLLDGNDTETEKETNITATEGGVTFVTASTGSIGTEKNPLEIRSAGAISFLDTDGNTGLKTDAYLDSGEDLIFAKDIVVDGTGEDRKTTLVATTTGNISFGNMTVKRGGLVNLTAGKDISFHIIESTQSNLTLTAGGSISSDGYLYFRKGTDTKLSLSTGGDIGSDKQYLLLDTDDTLYISKADNYYIDSVELVGKPFQRERPAEPATGSGRDENGDFKVGVLLQSGVAKDTVYGELGIQANTVLAEMVVDRHENRQDWIGLLGTDALVSLIRDGHITGETLKELLVSDTFTAEDIDQILAESDPDYSQLAAQLKPLLTDTTLLSDEMLATYLAQCLTDDKVNIDEMARILSGIVTEEELAQMLEAAWSHADYDSHKDARPDDLDPRELRIEVGKATGAAFVRNDGSIEIIQTNGTLMAGAIHSDRRNVTLTAQNGGIEGNGDALVDVMGENITLQAKNGVGAQTTLTIEQRENRPTLVGNVTSPKDTKDATIKPLDADSKPTSESEKALWPWTDWGLKTIITFDWIRAVYEGEATRLNVIAGGDVNIQEQTGDLGIGVIQVTNGNLNLTAPGSILDNRKESQTANNLTVTGNVTLTAENGHIGDPDQYLTTDVGGTITATAKGDISIDDKASLVLIADSKVGQVNASAVDDLTLRNISGDLIIGPITAGGTATITATENLVEGDKALVTAKSIVLTAKGDIGTEEDPLKVDTDAANGGTLTATGENLYIREVDGDVILKKITSTSDTVLTADGSILDANTNLTDKAVEAQKEAANAKAEADEAEAKAFVKTEEAKQAEEALKKAEDAVAKAKAMKDSRAKKKALEKAEKALAEATADYDAAKAAADIARAEAAKKRQEAEAKQQEADAAAEAARKQETTVTTGGDLTLNAGGNIGSEDNSMSAQVGGSVDANGGNIHIAGSGDLNFRETQTTGTVEISTADGNITAEGTITAGALDISALGGDVGQSDNYLDVSTDHLDAMGDNVYIRNDKDTLIGQIISKDDVKLDSQGNVTGDGTTQPNVIAKDIAINANGDIGTKDQPLDISGEAFHGTGKDIYLDNHTKDLDISGVKSDKLDVTTDGNVTGKDNWMHDIRIDADGYVGEAKDPFTFTADGIVKIHGGLGTWYRNLFAFAGEVIGTRDSTRYGAWQDTLVLRFNVTIGGEAYSLYVLVSFTESGTILRIGCYLCKGIATEAFWMEVLADLTENGNGAPRRILFTGEPELEAVLAKTRGNGSWLDLSRLDGDFGKALHQALTGHVTDPESLCRQMEALQNAVNAAIQRDFSTQEDALNGIESGISTILNIPVS